MERRRLPTLEGFTYGFVELPVQEAPSKGGKGEEAPSKEGKRGGELRCPSGGKVEPAAAPRIITNDGTMSGGYQQMQYMHLQKNSLCHYMLGIVC